MREPTLLLTRPQESAARFAATLDPAALAGVRVLIAPLMRIDGVAGAPAIGTDQAVIFTSAQGVLHAPPGAGRIAYCVGAATTQAALAAGWQAASRGGTAEALIASLSRVRPDRDLLHLSGAHQRGDIAERLSDAGVPTARRVIYRQTLLPLSEAARAALAETCIVPLFSPRTAAQFAVEAPVDLPQARIATLSAAVGAALGDLRPAEVLQADAPTGAAMRKTVEKLCLKITSA